MERRKFLGLGATVVGASMLPMSVLNATDFRATKPDAWEAAKSADAIKALYGDVKLITTDKIKMKAPKLAENGGSIPIKLTSKMDLESIAVFQDANPRSTVCVFTVPKNGTIAYDLRMKMRSTSDITVIAKGRDGQFYKLSQKVEVSIGGCGG
jgi:sulfur-oxidizing protein SoxY